MAEKVIAPDGTEWSVRRRLASRERPRWRRFELGNLASDAPRAMLEAGPPDELEAIPLWIAAVVLLFVLLVVVLPLLLLGIELVLLGVLVAAGILARGLLGRPWVVRATSASGEELAWEVRGWRRSGRAIGEVAESLARGVAPAPDAG